MKKKNSQLVEAESKKNITQIIWPLEGDFLLPFMGGKSGRETWSAEQILMSMIQDRIMKGMLQQEEIAVRRTDPEDEFVKNSSILNYSSLNGENPCIFNYMVQANFMHHAQQLGFTAKPTTEIPGRTVLGSVEFEPRIIQLFRKNKEITKEDVRWGVERFRVSGKTPMSIVRYAQFVDPPIQFKCEIKFWSTIKEDIIEKILMTMGEVGAARKKYGKFVLKKI
jgi:hypothetical protein